MINIFLPRKYTYLPHLFAKQQFVKIFSIIILMGLRYKDEGSVLAFHWPLGI